MDKEDLEIKELYKNLQKKIYKRYKRTVAERITDFLSSLVIILMFFGVLILIGVVLISLIENPTSIAIILGFILMMVIWWTK